MTAEENLRKRTAPLPLEDVDAGLTEALKKAVSLSQRFDLLERWTPVVRDKRVDAEKAYKLAKGLATAKARAKARRAGHVLSKKGEQAVLEKDPDLAAAFVAQENAIARDEALKAEYKVMMRAYRREVYGDRV